MAAFFATFAAPVFALLYLSAPHVIARWLPQPPALVPVMVRLAALLVLFLGVGVPPLVGAFVDDPSDPALNIFNPVVGLHLIESGKAVELALPLLAFFAVGWTIWAMVQLRRRDVSP